MQDVGLPCILNHRRSQHEVQTIIRRIDYFDSQGVRGGRFSQGVGRRHDVAEHTIYRWKAKFGGLTAPQGVSGWSAADPSEAVSWAISPSADAQHYTSCLSLRARSSTTREYVLKVVDFSILEHRVT